MKKTPHLGVAICTYNSADVILDCLESLLASTDVNLSIVIADNASTDGTVGKIEEWAAGRIVYKVAEDCPFELKPVTRPQPLPLNGDISPGFSHRIQLIEVGVNGGFAMGVNAALGVLHSQIDICRYWIVNPDSMVPETTASAFALCPVPPSGFSLMGGRVVYLDDPDRIQIDGGTINKWTGVTSNINFGLPSSLTPPPSIKDMDFITGASMVASRKFYETAGPMPEEYFLYYEEVDWALQRGSLPLVYCATGIVYHRAGTAIGSPKPGKPASIFSLFFKHRNRIRFVMRHFPASIPTAMLYSIAKAAQLSLKGFGLEATTLLLASIGCKPSAQVRDRLSAEAQKRAF
jgi:GT2 family glycosyltransferase